MNTTGTLWRDTARPIRFGFLDARVAIGLSAWFLYMSWVTFWFSIILIVLFIIFDRYGVTPPAAWRLFKQSFFNPMRTDHGRYYFRRISRW